MVCCVVTVWHAGVAAIPSQHVTLATHPLITYFLSPINTPFRYVALRGHIQTNTFITCYPSYPPTHSIQKLQQLLNIPFLLPHTPSQYRSYSSSLTYPSFYPTHPLNTGAAAAAGINYSVFHKAIRSFESNQLTDQSSPTTISPFTVNNKN